MTVAERIAAKLIRRAEYNEMAFGDKAMLGAELRRQAKEILDEFGPANEAPPDLAKKEEVFLREAIRRIVGKYNECISSHPAEFVSADLAREFAETMAWAESWLIGPANEAEKGTR